jgi:hypothetical protein
VNWREALEQAGCYQSVFSEDGVISEYSDGKQDFWLVSSPEAGQDVAARTTTGVELVLEELGMAGDGWR